MQLRYGSVSILNYALYSTGTVYLRLTIVNTTVLSTCTGIRFYLMSTITITTTSTSTTTAHYHYHYDHYHYHYYHYHYYQYHYH